MAVLDKVELIGESDAIQNLRASIGNIAKSDARVLITGENGSGKEIVARMIHNQSRRSNLPYVAINTAGLAENLLQAELFGYVKGSFTGAYADKHGKLEVAHMGTAFLDEIGNMPLTLQGMLLRFLQNGEIEKIGSTAVGKTVDVRVISATNRNLMAMVGEGTFREDLYYRLNIIPVVVPPLRQHSEDIPLLIQHFLKYLRIRSKVTGFDDEAIGVLKGYRWPGNVRELSNLVENLAVTLDKPTVSLQDLHPNYTAVQPPHDNTISLSVARKLYDAMIHQKVSFWTEVYPVYIGRQITKKDLRELVAMGLEESRGNYRIVTRLFNIEQKDYKKFLNFLRKSGCQVPHKPYRDHTIYAK